MPTNRLTAYKVWISDLINSNYVKMPGEFESNYLEFGDKQVSRINIIATVVNKNESQDKNYVALVLDDGTEQIRIKTWGEDTRLVNNLNIGETILVIGKTKTYNDELYILPEIVKNVNLNWEVARKLELIKLYGKPSEYKDAPDTIDEEKQVVEEIKFNTNNLRNELLNLIEKYEDKLGI